MGIVFLGICAGSVAGNLIAVRISGIYETDWYHEIGFIYSSIIMTILLNAIFCGFIFYWEKISGIKAGVKEKRVKRLLIEKKLIEMQLRTLQAQIEPHFLFNTLANIVSLFESDLDKAKAMQRDLIEYLKTSLTQIRSEQSTLGQEIELTESYLRIFKIRMGDRIDIHIDVPDRLRPYPFPPMLIQPLVENAIKHGLEPKEEGGQISIKADETPNRLSIIITDTGVGLDANTFKNIGLKNTRERIALFFENNGNLILKDHQPCGVQAVIEIIKP